MSTFYLGAAICLLLALFFIVFPWLGKQNKASQDILSNKSVIRQRLGELLTEQEHGLLSDADRLLSEKELKLTLLDEVKDTQNPVSSVKIAFGLGALISVSAGIAVYWYANQIKPVDHWLTVQSKTSELGQRMISGDETLDLQDMQDFALGLRTKLVDTPDDAVGWMLLGRISGSINRIDSAIQAFEKSLQYTPNNIGTLSSYAQALLMTGQEQQVLRAKQVLLHILNLEPDNTNAMGVLAIVASELGDKPLALENWQRLIAFIPQTDPNYGSVNQRIVQLQADLGKEANQQVAQNQPKPSADNLSSTRVSVTITISDDLQKRLPENGYLFVFAQESTGKMRMPAAVVKMPLGEFPVVVELSNDNAMTPNYTLSQLQQAKLVARVSIDGNGTQSAGDFQGEWIATLSANQMTQETITIDREL